MSSLTTVAQQLVDLCRQGKNLEAIRTLYAADVVSVEAAAPPGQERTTHGRDAVIGKGAWWMENHVVHGAETDGPYPHGDDRFAVLFDYDVTFKPTGQRHRMKEVAVFTVTAGQIVHEEFYYPT